MSEQEKSEQENTDKVTDTLSKVSDRVTDKQIKVTDKREMIVKKMVAKALENGDKLTQNRITILQLMAENPYITKIELAFAVVVLARLLLCVISNICVTSTFAVLDQIMVVSGKS